MRRRTWLIAAAGVAALLAGGWYWGSPWWTLWRMRQAAAAGDLATLGAYIDAQSISANHISEHRRWWRSMLAIHFADTDRAREFVALSRRQLARPDRELAFHLEEVRPWLSEMPIRFTDIGVSRRDPGGRPYIRHHGLSVFEVRYRDWSDEYGPVLGFRRDGLQWKLTSVRLGQQ